MYITLFWSLTYAKRYPFYDLMIGNIDGSEVVFCVDYAFGADDILRLYPDAIIYREFSDADGGAFLDNCGYVDNPFRNR